MGMSRSFTAVLGLLLIADLIFSQSAPAQKPNSESAEKGYDSELPRIPPKTPGEALKAFRLHPGFRIELAAAEPLLASPVALDRTTRFQLRRIDCQGGHMPCKQ